MAVKISPFGKIVKIWEISLENSLLGFILLVAGIILLVYGGGIVKDAAKSSKWNLSEGTIVHSDLDSKWVSGVGKDGRVKWEKVYSSDIAYTYLVDYKQYRSNKIRRQKYWDKSDFEAKSDLKLYPKWSKVNVYSNPEDPSDAILEPGVVYIDFFVLTLGGLFVGLGLLAIWKK